MQYIITNGVYTVFDHEQGNRNSWRNDKSIFYFVCISPELVGQKKTWNPIPKLLMATSIDFRISKILNFGNL